jgi:AraC family transcriptional regulator
MRGATRGVLDESKVNQAVGYDYTGAVVEHRRLAGAHVARIMHPPRQRIGAHGHDWPVLTLYRMGAYREEAEDGAIVLDGPSVVFQPAGAAHEDEIGDRGLEALALAFDPAWLSAEARAAMPRRTQWRLGGRIAARARALALTWLTADGARVREETSRFLAEVFTTRDVSAPAPAWAARVAEALETGPHATAALARSLALHPAWLARAYRSWRGEGMAETVRRRRVERAALLLRASAAPLADIAAECGFCDQSHMNRSFHAVLNRTPLEVRREAPLLAPLAP